MRAPRYGELGVVNLPSEVKVIWHSRNDELPELPSWRWSFQHQTDLQQVEDREVVLKLMEGANLNFEQAFVLEMMVVREYTLAEVGRRLDLSRERVRQILVRALRKCSHPHRVARVFNPLPMAQRSMQ